MICNFYKIFLIVCNARMHFRVFFIFLSFFRKFQLFLHAFAYNIQSFQPNLTKFPEISIINKKNFLLEIKWIRLIFIEIQHLLEIILTAHARKIAHCFFHNLVVQQYSVTYIKIPVQSQTKSETYRWYSKWLFKSNWIIRFFFLKLFYFFQCN